MLFCPKNIKYNKSFFSLPSLSDIEVKSNSISLQFGSFGLKTLESGHISAKQIEACRRIIIRSIRKSNGSKFWICIFPFISITRKPKEVRMGKGKGGHFEWVASVKKGKILFEIKNMNYKLAILTLEHMRTKLSLKSKVVKND